MDLEYFSLVEEKTEIQAKGKNCMELYRTVHESKGEGRAAMIFDLFSTYLA